MKLKNVEKLQERAEAHAKFDRVKQGTYGMARINGKPEFKGCAIGCLATPAGQEELSEFLVERGVSPDVSWDYVSWDDDETMIDILTDEFGFTYEFARLMESMFEQQPSHGDAIEFIPRFTKLLRDDVEYDDHWIASTRDRLDADDSFRRTSRKHVYEVTAAIETKLRDLGPEVVA